MSGSQGIKAGAKFFCEECGRESIAKVHREMDGWECVGEFLVCAFCNAKVGVVDEESEEQEEAVGEGLDRLSSFLGVGVAEKPKGIGGDSEEVRCFCRDCRHFLRHPFQHRCMLHDRVVEPMDDCPDFERRPLDDEAGADSDE